MPLPANDPTIDAITQRLRSVIDRTPSHSHDALAVVLGVAPGDFARLIDQRERVIDVAFLIDVIAALVREFGIDPQWLLTGRYDAGLHRRALAFGEDRNGTEALRTLIREQYRRMRDRS